MIVIGDVHGCYYTLKKLLKKLPQDKKLCFVGDLIDRGNYSDKVYLLVRDLINNNKAVCVRGNHEEMFIDFFVNAWDDPEDLYLLNGGQATINSFKGHINEVKDFFLTLPYTYTYKNFIISHALSWGIKNDYDIIWNRYINIPAYNKDTNFYVFGHTPKKEVYICDKVINIDTGACFKHYGILSAIDLDTFKIYSVKTDKKDIEVY